MFEVPVLWGLSHLTLGGSSLGGARPAGGAWQQVGVSAREGRVAVRGATDSGADTGSPHSAPRFSFFLTKKRLLSGSQ